jgi:hypothetical protein
MSKKSIHNSRDHSERDRTTRGKSCVFQYQLQFSSLAVATFLLRNMAPPRSNNGENFYEIENANFYV